MPKANKIKWVTDDEVAKAKVGRKAQYDISGFIEELYANPGAWAMFPEKVNSHAWAYRIPQRYAQIEVVQTGGNNLSGQHPDKKLWTVYMRYNPELDSNNKEK